MIELLSRSSGKVVGLKVSGKLVHADYQEFVPMVEELIREHGSLRCCVEVIGTPIPTPHALWDELKFDLKHCQDVERCAVVAESAWVKWANKLGGLIFRKAEIRLFEPSESERAWEWLSEETPCDHSAEPEVATAE